LQQYLQSRNQVPLGHPVILPVPHFLVSPGHHHRDHPAPQVRPRQHLDGRPPHPLRIRHHPAPPAQFARRVTSLIRSMTSGYEVPKTTRSKCLTRNWTAFRQANNAGSHSLFNSARSATTV
jgi:hypothetical protein